jgi:hypothetical protein
VKPAGWAFQLIPRHIFETPQTIVPDFWPIHDSLPLSETNSLLFRRAPVHWEAPPWGAVPERSFNEPKIPAAILTPGLLCTSIKAGNHEGSKEKRTPPWIDEVQTYGMVLFPWKFLERSFPARLAI